MADQNVGPKYAFVYARTFQSKELLPTNPVLNQARPAFKTNTVMQPDLLSTQHVSHLRSGFIISRCVLAQKVKLENALLSPIEVSRLAGEQWMRLETCCQLATTTRE